MNAPARTTLSGSSAGSTGPASGLSHEHEWVLRGVDFEDSGSVNHYGCDCGQVWFE